MSVADSIPVYTLFGETEKFPDLIHCERIRDRAPGHGWVITPHRHRQISQLFLIETGSAVARIDGKKQELSAKEFLFIPPGVVHSFTFAPGSDGLVLSFPVPAVGRFGLLTTDGTDHLASHVCSQITDRLAALARLLTAAITENGTYRAQMIISLAHATLAEVAEVGSARDISQAAPMESRIQRLDALIAEHLAEGWRPGDYAQALSITTGHLSRICRAARGLNASAYIEAAAMAEASRLLAFTRTPVAEIGYRLGFSDPSYFSRRFRGVHGQSPSGYRARFIG